MGYWVQSDMLDMLSFGGGSDFHLLAPLLYVVAAIGGLIGVAIGAPPRNYMWFFLGPAIYGWLIDTRDPATGVQWQVGLMPMDQREVWKLSETGLINTNLAKRFDSGLVLGGVVDYLAGGHYISSANAPADVYVSNFFLWWDSLLSSVITGMVDWVGPYSLRDNIPIEDLTNIGEIDIPFVGDDESATVRDKWFLLSNLKWTILENITSAKLTDPVLRDAFATFMGGTCGEEFAKAIDETQFVRAAHARGTNIPPTVFRQTTDTSASAIVELGPYNMEMLARYLRDFEVAYTDPGLKRLFRNKLPEGVAGGVGSFYNAVHWRAEDSWITGDLEQQRPTIRCDTYLMLMILAFRWEAGHIFAQLVNNAPDIQDSALEDITSVLGSKAARLTYNLFYGWDIRDRVNGPLDFAYGALGNVVPGLGALMDVKGKEQLLYNLILSYLIRNEFALVNQPVDVRMTGSDLNRNWVEGQQRTVGQKSKFGELYSWAILMPYLQGVLLYYLAMGYPLACLMMIVPGWHKSLFTWMSFWAWVKLWDLGFALVMSIERTVWAMIGNNSTAAGMFDRVQQMSDWGGANIAPHASASGLAAALGSGGIGQWTVHLTDSGVGGVVTGLTEPGYNMMLKNFRIMDQAMAISSSLDLDLSNAYYIYIMAALYFAVPAVTGQLVLGARAGASGLVSSALGQVTGEAGKGAGSGYTGDATQRLKSNASSIGQAAQVAAWQKSGLAAAALEMGNQQALQNIKGSYLGGKAQAVGFGAEMKGLDAQQKNSMLAYPRAFANYEASAKGDAASQAGGALRNPVTGAMGQGAGYVYSKDNMRTQAGFDKLGADASSQATQASKEALAQRAMLNPEQYSANALGAAFGRAGQFKQAEAQFSGDMARWNKMNQMANQLGGAAAAMGIYPGTIDPGPKPVSMEGMAMSGMLGSSAKRAAEKFDPFGGGGVFRGIAAQKADLAGYTPRVQAAPSYNQLWSEGQAERSSVPTIGEEVRGVAGDANRHVVQPVLKATGVSRVAERHPERVARSADAVRGAFARPPGK